jgi:hypothetical protein
MRNGSRSLGEVPHAVVRIDCECCGRAGSYRRSVDTSRPLIPATLPTRSLLRCGSRVAGASTIPMSTWSPSSRSGSSEPQRDDADDKRDAEAAEAERLRDEGKHVVTIGWGDGGKTIEHEGSPEPSNKD